MSRALRSLTTAILLAAAGVLPAAAADVADEVLAKGIEAYHAGKLEPAIGGINAALRGRLSAAQVARAHYYRGLAYRKQGNPGRAITDLTRALDYPGLSDAERSDAMEARSAAYQEAGIADQETVVLAADSRERDKRAHAAPPPAHNEAARRPEATNTWTTASTSTSMPTGAPPAAKPAAPKWDGATQVAIAAPLAPAVPAPTASAPAPAAPQAAAKPAASTWTGGTRVAAAVPAQPTPARQKQPPQAAKPTPPSGLDTAPAAMPAARAPSSPSAEKAAGPAAPAKWAAKQIAMAPLPPVPVHKAAAQPATPGWSTAQVAVAAPSPPAKPLPPPDAPLSSFVTQVAAVIPAAPPAPPPVAPLATPPAAPAEVRLLVGEARSRSEAFALAIRLTSQRGAALGPRKPQIAETTVIGAGLVYRVRLGPFADAGQAQTLCGSLRSSGYPCVVE